MNEKNRVGFNAILALTPMIIYMGALSAMAKGAMIGIRRTYHMSNAPTVQEFERWMAEVWKAYGRKQPKHYIAE